MRDRDAPDVEPIDVLIVGAGPTGLTLAAQLHAFGVRFRIVDRLHERGRESRALAVQARSLEILQQLGLADALIARGNPSARLVLHVGGRVVGEVALADWGTADPSLDTRFPFILFVSQAETEAVLVAHLTSRRVTIERGAELTAFEDDGHVVTAALHHADGREERVRARYLVGCDGANSAVRRGAGIPFEGGEYLEDFVLGDVEIDGPVTPDALHSFVGDRGFTMCFPLGRPTTWRVIAMAPTRADPDAAGRPDLSLGELQSIVDGATGGALRLGDAAWLTHFRLHHRQTAHYRAGRVFVAGDAAHIHSPVGAQGMNTGIQDAWNLGWKLALVVCGAADDELLDTYEAERWPVGRFLLRVTDRIFGSFVRLTTPGRVVRLVQREVVPRVLPRVVASRRLRAAAFRFVSELAIRYRRSPGVAEGRPRLVHGPRAGDRVPDLPLTRDGVATSLQRELAGPALHLVLCGARDAWDTDAAATIRERFGVHLEVAHLCPDGGRGLAATAALESLGVSGDVIAAQYLVRPDLHVAFRCAGTDLGALRAYLERWYAGGRVAPRSGGPR
jgi:2-polyprenyl-6-methoxyphenol hydroxylase-like FAD-dependent oxidoreductase